jgi:type I restriction enzyme S subunit
VGDLLIERNQQAPMSDEYPLMAFIANEGVAPKGERYDRSALVTDTVNKLYKKTEKGDFIYSSNNLETGSIGLNKYGKACISPVYSIFEPTGIADSDFLGRRLVRKDFINTMVKWRQGVIYGQWRIHESDFLKIEIAVPSVEEQRKIGTYLDQLDNLITLHQRKYDKLQVLKKAMLEKMFPKNGSSVPEIRFKGFTDAWEQRKLGEIVERITRKNENLESTLPLTISAQYGLIDQNEFFDKRIASKDVSGYFLVKNGEFAYNKSTSSDAPWGAIKRLDRYESGVLSTLYIVFKILDERKTSSDYIVTYYNTDLWHKGIQAIAAEGARNHGLLNVAPADFFETNLTMPKDYAEQQQIGSFFQQLDHLITLHQRELEKLQNIKKSMLEKMFA